MKFEMSSSISKEILPHKKGDAFLYCDEIYIVSELDSRFNWSPPDGNTYCVATKLSDGKVTTFLRQDAKDIKIVKLLQHPVFSTQL